MKCVLLLGLIVFGSWATALDLKFNGLSGIKQKFPKDEEVEENQDGKSTESSSSSEGSNGSFSSSEESKSQEDSSSETSDSKEEIEEDSCLLCGSNEEYTTCGSSCGDRCDARSVNCANICIKGCYCKRGYCRHPRTLTCVPYELQDWKYHVLEKTGRCGANEEYSECGNNCRESCRNRNCIENCEVGCFCKKDYARHPYTSKCIRRDCCTDHFFGDY